MPHLMVDRPAWTEVVGVLVACALVLAVLVHLDAVSARDAGARRAPAPSPHLDAPSPQRSNELLALVLAGTGATLVAGGSVVLSRRP